MAGQQLIFKEDYSKDEINFLLTPSYFFGEVMSGNVRLNPLK